jgi:polysaccharide biosynthesis transport protein
MNRYWDEPKIRADPELAEHDTAARRAAHDQAAYRELHFPELISLLRRKRRLIFNIAFWGVVLVFAAALLIPPKYTAKAQIAVDLPSGGSQAAPAGRDEAALETHVQMLISREHLQRVLDDLLGKPRAVQPEAAAEAKTSNSADRAPLQVPPAHWLPDPSELAKRLGIWTGRIGNIGHHSVLNIDQFKRDVSANQEGRSHIIGVTYTSTDPETAATVASRIIELYVQDRKNEKQASARGELARLASRIAALKRDIEGSGIAAQQLMLQQGTSPAKQGGNPPDGDQRIQELEGKALANSQLYQFLLQRQEQIRNEEEVIQPDVHIVSLAATPDRPSSPNPFLFILPALVLFLILGSLLSVFLERIDRRLRSESDIRELLGIACIGIVPEIAKLGQTSQLHRYLLSNPFGVYTEALRSIIATLQLASPLRQPKVVLVTSSLPGEGKTTLALSLSISVALLRQRVLLMDLDLEHPTMLPDLRSKVQYGLVDLLFNSRPSEEAIQRIPELGLDYLQLGHTSLDPLVLFAGPEMSRVLHQLRGSYDAVIINSLPVLGNTATRVLAPLADETLLVVKWHSTTRELAQSALSLLRNAGATTPHKLPSVSAVMAQVDLERQARYAPGDFNPHLLKQEKTASVPVEAGSRLMLRASDNACLKDRRFKAAAAYRALKTCIARWTTNLLKALPGTGNS